VFFVREGVDDGPIIVQAVVPVMPGDDENILSERIRAQEHRIYPWAIQLFQEGRLTIEGRTVRHRRFPAGDESLAAGESTLAAFAADENVLIEPLPRPPVHPRQ